MWAEVSGGEDDDLLGDARPFKQSNSQSLFLSREPTDTRHGRMQIDVGELMWNIRIHSRSVNGQINLPPKSVAINHLSNSINGHDCNLMKKKPGSQLSLQLSLIRLVLDNLGNLQGAQNH
ncbi:unnamed protein product [Strongylus vulgaris]|uniref:Uncharacterized protein n=1 Tax=Strongylus vulgaris TaxID=40348 RepID=A0A3P7JAC1_STRVU|nr:unnamed protein product [Strongylus vulgaris]